ncbi:hypothetical protein SAMN06295888_10192 [Desulfonatronum zhilinae]|nr:hypothetical protein SAMN06295888_10192 [Desulfonatronum zhilinae]
MIQTCLLAEPPGFSFRPQTVFPVSMQPLDGHINRMIACLRQFRVFLAKADEMKIFFRNFRYFFAALVGISLSIWYTAYFLLHPPVYAFRLKAEGLGFALWPSEQILTLRWVLALLAVLLAGVAVALCLWAMKKTQHEQPRIRRAIDVLAPLSVLPLACVPLFTADIIPPILSTNAPLFILLGALSLSLAKLFTPLLDAGAASNQKTWPWAWGIFLIALIGYAHGGYQFSKAVGEHVGDEGHYLIQAQSLYEDGNLDITKQLLDHLGADDPAQVDRGHYHIAPQSRGDAFYSWHSFGLSLLLAPSWKWGLGGRHIVLGMISGIGLAGLFLLCRRVGAGNTASLLVVSSLGTSVFWGLYSYRALPEVLGATLIIWPFWAIVAQKQRPWLSLFVAAACCAYLPFAHTRFIPMSLMAIGFYGLFGLLGDEKLRPKLIRLSTFTILCLAGYAVYLAVHFSMFSGGSSYPIRETLFSYPLGAWAVLVGDRGLISLLPVLFWLFGAMVAWFWVDREHRLFCLGLFTTFLSCLLTSTTYSGYTGGSSVPGRYLVAVTPLLFVGAAIVLERVNLAARTWFIFLTLFSTTILFVVWHQLPFFGRSFTVPLHVLSSFPLLQDFFFPNTSYWHGTATEMFWTNIYIATALVLTTFVVFSRKKLSASFLAIFVILVFAIFTQSKINTRDFSFQRYTDVLHIDEKDFIVKKIETSIRNPWKSNFALHRMHSYTGKKDFFEGADVVYAAKNIHKNGEIVFGRHVKLFPGTFSVNFYFDSIACDGDRVVATLDVAAEHGDVVLKKMDVLCDDLSRTESLLISTDKFLVAEPRVYYHGGGDLRLRRIYIEEVIE